MVDTVRRRRGRACRAYATWLGCVFSALLSGLAAADQKDPRLDHLFAELHDASDVTAAAGIETRIWRIWLQYDDRSVAALMRHGVELMGTLRLDEAIAVLSEVVRRAPNFAEAWNKRATAFYLKQDLVSSMADIRRVLDLEPRHFGAISGLGLILIRRGDLGGALAAFEKVLSINPRSPSARVQAARLREALRHSSI